MERKGVAVQGTCHKEWYLKSWGEWYILKRDSECCDLKLRESVMDNSQTECYIFSTKLCNSDLLVINVEMLISFYQTVTRQFCKLDVFVPIIFMPIFLSMQTICDIWKHGSKFWPWRQTNKWDHFHTIDFPPQTAVLHRRISSGITDKSKANSVRQKQLFSNEA